MNISINTENSEGYGGFVLIVGEKETPGNGDAMSACESGWSGRGNTGRHGIRCIVESVKN